MSCVQKKWFRIASCESIPAREGRLVEIDQRQIAVFNLGDRFLAIENRCPHRGGPLADGIVSGTAVVCPLHAWKYDLVTGRPVNHPESDACVKTYPTRVEYGTVSVEIPLSSPAQEIPPATCQSKDRPLRWVQRKPLSPPAAEICQP